MRLYCFVILTTVTMISIACIPGNIAILETRYTARMVIKEIQHIPIVRLEVSGVSLHSSLVVSYVSRKKTNNAIVILVHLELAGMGKTGEFKYAFDVPNDVDVVCLGNAKTVLWRRCDENGRVPL